MYVFEIYENEREKGWNFRKWGFILYIEFQRENYKEKRVPYGEKDLQVFRFSDT